MSAVLPHAPAMLRARARARARGGYTETDARALRRGGGMREQREQVAHALPHGARRRYAEKTPLMWPHLGPLRYVADWAAHGVTFHTAPTGRPARRPTAGGCRRRPSRRDHRDHRRAARPRRR